jgi:hypothetical protein
VHEQLHINSHIYLGTLNEKIKYLERHKVPKLTQEEVENLNRHIAMKEIELEIRKVWLNVVGHACNPSS